MNDWAIHTLNMSPFMKPRDLLTKLFRRKKIVEKLTKIVVNIDTILYTGAKTNGISKINRAVNVPLPISINNPHIHKFE